MEAVGLRKSFGEVEAVRGVDVSVRAGEAFGFLGPNGAGKSSTMRMIACVSPPSAGTLRVLGLDPVHDGPAIRARLGVVPQADTLDEELSVLDNIVVYGRYFGLPRRVVRERALDLLEFANLADRAALMATSAMNGAVYDSTMNFYFKLRHAKLYDSVLATPLGVRDVALGELSWALLRGVVYSLGFYVVLLASGLVLSWWSVLAIPACSLIGFAFGALGMAGTTYARGWPDLDYVQLVVLPLFLFSATFYPLSTYPPALQWVVQATPLYHGVAMIRSLTTGQIGPDLLWHLGYLVVLGWIGLLVVSRRLHRTMYA